MQQSLGHGQVVSIFPRPGEIAPAVVGQVIRGGSQGSSPLPPAPADRVWVRYYKPPSAQHGGELRTELVELHRIQHSQAAMGQSFEAAMHALNGPHLPHSSRRDTSSLLVQLTSFGCKARHAEAALALCAGSMVKASAILRFQGQARQALGEIVLKPDNEDDKLTVVYSTLGVPTVLLGAPGNASLPTPPGQMRWASPPKDQRQMRWASPPKDQRQMRWASPPKDQLSRSTGARMQPRDDARPRHMSRDDARSRRMSQPGSQPVIAGGACTPVFPMRPSGSGQLRRATEIQGGARRISVTGLSGLGGA